MHSCTHAHTHARTHARMHAHAHMYVPAARSVPVCAAPSEWVGWVAVKSNGRTLINIACLLQPLNTCTSWSDTHKHRNTHTHTCSETRHNLGCNVHPGGTISFPSLHHFKGPWTVTTQTVPLLGHNHYNSCPLLLVPCTCFLSLCHFKGLWTVTAQTMISSLLDIITTIPLMVLHN